MKKRKRSLEIDRGSKLRAVTEKVDVNINSQGCSSRRLAGMRELRLRAEKVAPVVEDIKTRNCEE